MPRTLLQGAEALPEPRDPADLLDGLLSTEPSPEEWAESRSRLADAAAMGLPERVTGDVLLTDGPLTVEGVPTVSREAAWRAIDRAAEEHGGYPDTGPALTGGDAHWQRFAVWLLAERRELGPGRAAQSPT